MAGVSAGSDTEHMSMDELERFLAHARGSSGAAAASKIVRLDAHATQRSGATWELATLRGRLVELSARGATATLTAAIELVIEAQMLNEPVAWIAPTTGTFYPPDVAASGVDLAALVVVRQRVCAEVICGRQHDIAEARVLCE